MAGPKGSRRFFYAKACFQAGNRWLTIENVLRIRIASTHVGPTSSPIITIQIARLLLSA